MYSNLTAAYKNYHQEIMTFWENLIFDKIMIEEIEKLIQRNIFEGFDLESLSNPWSKTKSSRHYLKQDMLGITQRNSLRLHYRRTIIESVATTESYLQKICEIVYRDYPGRIRLEKTYDENYGHREKLFDIILNNNTRDEMLELISEERIRGIFYGNPIDFFVKDKGNIGLGDYFLKNNKIGVDKYKEIIARRNIIIHNNGRVDSKYLKESNKTGIKIGQMLKTNEMYLREMIFILRGLAAIVSKTVLKNIYQMDVKGLILQNADTFSRAFP
jgi:hypothetical protein